MVAVLVRVLVGVLQMAVAISAMLVRAPLAGARLLISCFCL